MSLESLTSDEPTRLAQIIGPLFADQSKGWSARLCDGGQASLLIGADAQDDCAIFQLSGNQELVLGSDYVRGSQFRLYELGYLDNHDIGYYLAMANFSDIAAMGARPIALLSVVRYPRELPDAEFETIMRGIQAACADIGAPNVGGDIGTAERIILSASAIGIVETGGALLRSGVSPGDRLCVSGPTGIAAAAQKYFGRLDVTGTRISGEQEAELLAAWKRPQALVRYGRCLSTSALVTSCQDTSDGLKAAIESLAALSHVGFVVDEEALPLTQVVMRIARLSDSDLTSLILGDSVDFELVFTVAPENLQQLREVLKAHGFGLFEIGTATEAPDVMLRRADGAMAGLPGTAWRHAD